VLPYLQEPYSVFATLLDLNAQLIILDKMPFLTDDRDDMITIQKVPAEIYAATYPAWFFNEKKFRNILTKKYEVIEEFEDAEVANVPSKFIGIIAKRKHKQ
jgi:putative methyltransferase (TIGR04325 family)